MIKRLCYILFFSLPIISCEREDKTWNEFFVNVENEKCDYFTEKYEKVLYDENVNVSEYDTDELIIYAILYNMQYEGEISYDRNDNGNYSKGYFCGTKYGISASFALNFIPCDSLLRLTKKDACKLLYDYVKNPKLEGKTLKFIMYYVTIAFYAGAETADVYFLDAIRWTGERNKIIADSVIKSINDKRKVDAIAEYMIQRLENRIYIITEYEQFKPYKYGWLRRIRQTKKDVQRLL